MRRFSLQCRGMSKVFVGLVRETETHLRERGQPVLPLARAAQAQLHGAPQVSKDQRVLLDTQLTAALAAHDRIVSQSRRLTQGKVLPHGKMVNAYDPTIAPIGKGEGHCPAQFGRKPGMIAEPAAGICPWGIRVMPVMWSPWSTKCSRRPPGSGHAPSWPSIRSRAIWR
jgi:hypothetical protein